MMSMYQKFDNNNNNHEENVNNVDEFYKMFLSIDDVNDAINEMKANNETNLINLYAKGGKMWIFLQQLSRIDRSNEDYYFHFIFQKALEINGAIQKFVSNDECTPACRSTYSIIVHCPDSLIVQIIFQI